MVGGQDELVFDGDSFVLDAEGRVSHQLPPFVEALRTIDIDIGTGGGRRVVRKVGLDRVLELCRGQHAVVEYQVLYRRHLPGCAICYETEHS